jgi:hypothetical protein
MFIIIIKSQEPRAKNQDKKEYLPEYFLLDYFTLAFVFLVPDSWFLILSSYSIFVTKNINHHADI